MKRVEVDGVSVLTGPVAEGPEPRREREKAAVDALLRAYFGREFAIGHHPSGAPYIEGRPENISISHSATTAAVAIASRGGFGIDTETLRPQLPRVRERFLSPAEQAWAGDDLGRMCRAWCAKEALYKAALHPGLPLVDGIRLYGSRAVAAGDTYRLVTVDETDRSATVLALKETPVGRFAPSPSGRMHLGNIFTAVLSLLSVKSRGGRWILRIEDLDPQRSRHEYAAQIEDDLRWLGLEWDEGGLDDRGPHAPYSQSRRGKLYEHYLDELNATGYTYPCRCTRAEILATQAPHASDGRVVYGGRCRPEAMPRPWAEGVGPEQPLGATRLYVPPGVTGYIDRLYGYNECNLAADCGDFILRRADGAWAYQLAVVVDDALMGVTEVVRGSDLLQSAPRQEYIYGLLGFAPPVWSHVPLLVAPDGRRLSKRDRSMSMDELRRRYTPEQLLGLIGRLAGLNPTGAPLSLPDLQARFTWTHIPSTPTLTVPGDNRD